MTKTIDQLVDELLGREGGYVNDPHDAGGETNFGITLAVARAHGYGGAMRDLPRSTAADIYKRIYWTRPGFDRVAMIAPDIAAELFDTGVNMGPAVAATFLQRALTLLNRGGKDYPDIVPDGRIGDQTISALKAFRAARGLQGMHVLLEALNVQQGCRYLDLAEGRQANETFLFGWLLNRVAA
jgi:lysozyme family protein